MVTMTSRM